MVNVSDVLPGGRAPTPQRRQRQTPARSGCPCPCIVRHRDRPSAPRVPPARVHQYDGAPVPQGPCSAPGRSRRRTRPGRPAHGRDSRTRRRTICRHSIRIHDAEDIVSARRAWPWVCQDMLRVYFHEGRRAFRHLIKTGPAAEGFCRPCSYGGLQDATLSRAVIESPTCARNRGSSLRRVRSRRRHPFGSHRSSHVPGGAPPAAWGRRPDACPRSTAYSSRGRGAESPCARSSITPGGLCTASVLSSRTARVPQTAPAARPMPRSIDDVARAPNQPASCMTTGRRSPALAARITTPSG
ncbi:hypothetical protein FHR81_003280 [Actinoalloteichus hoggarensis]|uniref:Uncharacterized protein n=1 Tax=Actinoalloteichus hoggarensis TaxID=1470176 RepID=A0A221W6Y1_9PSEU|nr:hypothetical protein AHOG_20085 [Actinoalloteichus hoggarensis]MBB5922228.1 hypothetical protein [Actinoalloteichus hoggarensis]